MVTIDRRVFSLGLLSQGQLRWSPSSRDNTLLSCPQFDHDLRGDSATEYQQVPQNSPNPDRLSIGMPRSRCKRPEQGLIACNSTEVTDAVPA